MTSQPATVPQDSDKATGLRFAKVLVWLVYAFFMFALIILTLAFFLLLFNANADSGFAEWVYRSANRVLEPFRGIFPSATADNGSVLDFAVLFAIIVYGILAMLVHAGIDWIDRKIAQERADTRYQAAQAEADRRAQMLAQQQASAQQQAVPQQQAPAQAAPQQQAPQQNPAPAPTTNPRPPA
jgi:uncharacterized protein YggT (Ycf19 family)